MQITVVISWLLLIAAAMLAIPVATLLIEIVAALLGSKTPLADNASDKPRPRIAVIVPAHNESSGILPTLRDIQAQLAPSDRLLVVADNCTDDTSAVATAAGAEVIARQDLQHIGKGYALDYGLKHLSGEPPDIVIMIDADCRLGDGAIDQLATACALTGRPVQALYLMTAPDNSAVNYQVAEFAWRVKNWARPQGLSVLNLPCQLTGTGMAFPWPVIIAAKLASGQIVEDLKLGLDLALVGRPALFCPSAVVTSEFPASNAAANRQRERWEHGHIGLILAAAPKLIWTALARRNLGLLTLALDLAVPPLSLLVLLIVVLLTLSAGASALGLAAPALMVSAANFLLLALAIGLAWAFYGRDVLPSRAIPSIAYYVFGKLHLYGRILTGKMATRWNRTDRSGS